jgi:DNA primase large subunit
MLRQDYNRIDPKRRNVVDHRKKQFATPQYKDAEYPSRLNFYAEPPTADITLEQFEQWAIDRLRGTTFYIKGKGRMGKLLTVRGSSC